MIYNTTYGLAPALCAVGVLDWLEWVLHVACIPDWPLLSTACSTILEWALCALDPAYGGREGVGQNLDQPCVRGQINLTLPWSRKLTNIQFYKTTNT